MRTKLLIIGITGDLGTRKLLPALEQVVKTGEFDDLSVIGISRHKIDTSKLFINCQNRKFLDGKLSTFTMDLDQKDEYKRLRDFVDIRAGEQAIIYLAIPPTAASSVVENLGLAGMNTNNYKLLFEKPFGRDLKSARELIKQTAHFFKEEQIYRIDHYLAKEMAQNIVAFRGKNALFSSVWNRKFISAIEITAYETDGINGRSHFYEQTGALRDIVQGHLMQLLALVLMDVPRGFKWEEMPKLRQKALGDLLPANDEKTAMFQYEGYRAESNNPVSNVETFVSVELSSKNPHWRGVPIRLSTGKALSKKTNEIKIYLKGSEDASGNCLTFRIQPNEGIDIELFVKKPDYGHAFEKRLLSFSYPLDAKLPDAYEQVLVDAVLSRKSLFTSSGEVLQSWRVLQPILDSQCCRSGDIKTYQKGTSPESIIA